jgi:hypothetical protein
MTSSCTRSNRLNSEFCAKAAVDASFGGTTDIKRLYVIGNGFDRSCKMKTRYCDFRDYLPAAFAREFEAFHEDLDTKDALWGNFEEALDSFNFAEIEDRLDDCTKQYVGESDPDPCDDPDYSLQNAATSLSHDLEKFGYEDLLKTFKTWISSIAIPRGLDTRSYGILDSPKTSYLSFNYTMTLEETFGIDESRINHIHGAIGGDTIILGHSPRFTDSSITDRDAQTHRPAPRLGPETSESTKRIWQEYHDHKWDECGVPVWNELSQQASESEKPVLDIIEDNRQFFDSLATVDQIIVLGHGFGEVDEEYFHELMRSAPEAYWFVPCYVKDHKTEQIRKQSMEKALKVLRDINAAGRLTCWPDSDYKKVLEILKSR